MRPLNSPSEVRPPYVCVVCHGDVGLVDTLYEQDAYSGWEYNGSVYLCTPCIESAGRAIGMVSDEELQYVRTHAQELADENAILREKHLEDVDAIIAAVKERKATKAADAVRS